MRPGKARWMLAIALGVIFGVGALFRVTSLETMHFPDADEAWYGVEATRLARGEAMATRTTCREPARPLYRADRGRLADGL